MGYVKNDEIIGYELQNVGVFCCECFSKEHPDYDVSEDEIIVETDRDHFDGKIFCDNCNERI